MARSLSGVVADLRFESRTRCSDKMGTLKIDQRGIK